ncbi:hypothetical protein HOY80DRAFT_1026280 [Tuber brumale]|nr:hypothetical protein HOY80DRAFT_1026280 [Tuber brumale]
MSLTKKNFSSEQCIELALTHLNCTRKEDDRIPTFDELADDYEVPRLTLWHRHHGRIPTTLVKEMAMYLCSKWDPEKAQSIGYNWYLSFLARHQELGLKYSRQIENVRVEAQQDYFVFAKFFERESFWKVLEQVRAGGLTKKNILSGFEATGIYPLNGQKILQSLPGYDSYQPTPAKSQTTRSTPPYKPKTPKTESENIESATFAEKSIYHNTVKSRSGRAAIRFLAHSVSLHCSTLNLQHETERKEGINSGKKGKRRIKVDNSAISAGDVKKIIQTNYSVQWEGEQKKLVEKRERYRELVKEKENTYEKLKAEERGALEGLNNLDIEYEEGEDEREAHRENGLEIGIEVEEGEDSC